MFLEQDNIKEIKVVTRFNIDDSWAGGSSVEALEMILNTERATITGINNLHSKVYIFDDKEAIVTSANFTNGGLKGNLECGVSIDEEDKVAELIEYFDTLNRAEDAIVVTQEMTKKCKVELNNLKDKFGTKENKDLTEELARLKRELEKMNRKKEEAINTTHRIPLTDIHDALKHTFENLIEKYKIYCKKDKVRKRTYIWNAIDRFQREFTFEPFEFNEGFHNAIQFHYGFLHEYSYNSILKIACLDDNDFANSTLPPMNLFTKLFDEENHDLPDKLKTFSRQSDDLLNWHDQNYHKIKGVKKKEIIIIILKSKIDMLLQFI